MRTDIVDAYLEKEELQYWEKRALIGKHAMSKLKNTCSGTCLVVGNGLSQNDIPLEWIHKHKTFGLNFCHRKEGFNPTYFVVGDMAIALLDWPAAYTYHINRPMFLPSPNLDAFGTEREVYRYARITHHTVQARGEINPTTGITFSTVAIAASYIAVYMGYKRLLYIGLDGGDPAMHFYGKHIAPESRHKHPELSLKWDRDFANTRRLLKVQMVNLSTQTTITSLQKDDWRKY